MRITYHPTCCKFREFILTNDDTADNCEKIFTDAITHSERVGYTACLQGFVKANRKDLYDMLVKLGFYSSPQSFNCGGELVYFMFLPLGKENG